MTKWFAIQDIFNLLYFMCLYSSWRQTYGSCWDGLNYKNWISQERNMTFLWNKKILKPSLKDKIFTSDHFLDEVTFQPTKRLVCSLTRILLYALYFTDTYCVHISFKESTLLKLKLTHLFPMHPFSTSWKHQKTWRFPVFRGERKDALGTNWLISWSSNAEQE